MYGKPVYDPVLKRNNGQMKNISVPSDSDVLCGRGGSANNHRGNERYRRMIFNNKVRYLSSGKKEKAVIARELVTYIYDLDPPGRFLAKNPRTNLYNDVGEAKAMYKVGQALREGAPAIRKMLEAEREAVGGHGQAVLVPSPVIPGKAVCTDGTVNGIFEPELHPRDVDFEEQDSLVRYSSDRSVTSVSDQRAFSSQLQRNDLHICPQPTRGSSLKQRAFRDPVENKNRRKISATMLLPTCGLDNATASALMAFQDVCNDPGSYIGASRSDGGSEDELGSDCRQPTPVRRLSPADVLCVLRGNSQAIEEYRFEDRMDEALAPGAGIPIGGWEQDKCVDHCTLSDDDLCETDRQVSQPDEVSERPQQANFRTEGTDPGQASPEKHVDGRFLLGGGRPGLVPSNGGAGKTDSLMSIGTFTMDEILDGLGDVNGQMFISSGELVE
mmetsp:Transcript_532/g.1251  ORF Transcript_532/g.1251 Transcript_532/m.1251 type:complete len:442 (+) Transcript_532:114-1439(+)|eukprot:CAMPEP_0194312954 /NCGR_PEP_ID=MMETSP0171-20130528/9847_1 /TAXON_ID=218684 /ORGANISM="Corethron pennatum, Strain L29A3" /LENGTH=441 /DNA_ID=CAMNT_0039067687 /DNA_START=78 /DNA_END=1403 /DNA_ORIENTATION=-